MKLEKSFTDETKVLIGNLKELVFKTRKQALKTINTEMVRLYYEIGRRIIENEQKGNIKSEYGEKLIARISEELTKEFGKGFSRTQLKQMRQFYLLYQIGRSLTDQFEPVLSWTHYCELIKIDDEIKRKFYERYAIEEGLSIRDLKRQIGSLFYERLALSTEKKSLIVHEREKFVPATIDESIKDPYILEFLDLADRPEYTEGEVEQAIVDNLQKFLLELGQGFSFVARQKRFTIDNDHFYIDLLLYNIHLKSYIVIEIKNTKFKHEYAGQMNFYLNYVIDQLNKGDDNEPIGIILCADNSGTTQVKYSLTGIDKKIFPSAYKVSLPKVEDLQRIVERVRYNYLNLSEPSLNKVWDNDEDDIYNDI